jgi:hypothetical protein
MLAFEFIIKQPYRQTDIETADMAPLIQRHVNGREPGPVTSGSPPFVIHSLMTIQPFIGSWPLSQFRNPIHSRWEHAVAYLVEAQTERSRVRFPMTSLYFSIHLILQAAL